MHPNLGLSRFGPASSFSHWLSPKLITAFFNYYFENPNNMGDSPFGKVIRMLRQPIVVTVGHVDHGKTTLLDAVRETTVASREAGLITQSIGASEVPLEIIKDLCQGMLEKMKINLTIPGLLFIDTPGHAAFANLRRRGGSVADIAVLVVDVTQGIQEQTLESIYILKEYKVPFVVAANKIDLIDGWKPEGGKCFTESYALQRQDVQQRLDEKIYKLVGDLYGQGFSADQFDRVGDFTKQVVIVPVSAKTKEGLQELLLFISGLAQKFLEKRLELHEHGGRGSILEVKEEKGFGKTLDVILFDGSIKVNDKIVFASLDGAVESKVKALLTPKPLDEMRDPRERFSNVKEARAACGVKIACERADEALAGSSLFVLASEEEATEAAEQIRREMKEILVETEENGVIVRADALGSVEAITKLFVAERVRVRKASIGSPTKKDLIEAGSVAQEDKFLGAVFAFNVPVDAEILAQAAESGVKLFKENIIYNLIEGYKNWVAEEKARERKEAFAKLVLPAKILVLPGNCFRTSNPCIFGIEVLAGTIRKGYKLIDDENKVVGEIKEIQSEKQKIEEAKRGMQVAISMDEPFFGRQVKEKQALYTAIPREHAKIIEEKYLQALGEEEKELLKEIKKLRGYRAF
jgi:translation initiation factor 5B